MTNSSNEKALELLARAIAAEIWRRLAEESPRADDFSEADGRDGQKVAGEKDDREKDRPAAQRTRENHGRPAKRRPG
jgi:hypothetical protein